MDAVSYFVGLMTIAWAIFRGAEEIADAIRYRKVDIVCTVNHDRRA